MTKTDVLNELLQRQKELTESIRVATAFRKDASNSIIALKEVTQAIVEISKTLSE